MIPFDELCAALDRHRRGLAPEPHAAAAHAEAPAHDENATQLAMQAPVIESAQAPAPDNTGEIDIDDVIE